METEISIDNAAEESDGEDDVGRTTDHSAEVDTQLILDRTNNKPRYMFRAYSSGSRGFNSNGLFKSQAAKEGNYRDVESLTESEMKTHLKKHIGHEELESHFISFSVSYLWVFRKALRMKEQGRQDVRIVMLESFEIPRGTWVRHAHSMLRGYGADADLMMKNLGVAELLVWDELRVSMNETKLDDMLNGGVLTLLPIFKMPNNEETITG